MAENAVAAGATFLVGPHCDKDIARFCRDRSIPYIPGALTPTEIYNAWLESGVMVKVFPASVFGPSYIKSLIQGPFNGIKLLVTGGININNVKDYIQNGACGIAIGGGTVYKKELIASGNWDELQSLLTEYVTAVKAVKMG